MKLAIMQPYLFPYIGYLSLMEYADEFILFDTAQYDRKGWMNRNRILKPQQGWQYIRAGVIKPPFRASIQDVKIAHDNQWKETIIRQLEHYSKVAPHYESTLELVTSNLARPAKTLTELNKNILESLRDALKITCPIRVFSELNLKQGNVLHAGQWALRISEAAGATEYVNPPGGKDLFKVQDFEQAGIKLTFLSNQLSDYNQCRDLFEPGLSIIDTLMFCSRDDTKSLLTDFTTEEANNRDHKSSN